jgi:hypothetical protein
MARIPTYEIDASISDLDMLIGTDYDNQEYTKNFTLGSIAEYVLDKFIDPDAVQSCIPVFRNISDTQGGNATRITSSIINQNIYPNGSNISVSGTLDAIKKIQVKGNGSVAGQIELNCENNNHGVAIQAPPHASSAAYTMILPVDMGTAGKQLTTDGASQLYWADPEDDNLDIAADTNTGSIDLDTQALTISGGTLITTSVIPDGGQNITIQHDSVNRTDVDDSTDLQFGDSFNAISILTSDQGGHVENVTTQEYTLPETPVTSIVAGTNVSISPTSGIGSVTVNAADQVPADNITGSIVAGKYAIGQSANAIDAGGDPVQGAIYSASISSDYVSLGAQGPGYAPYKTTIQNYDGGNNPQGGMELNQQGRLTVGLNGGGNGGQVLINPSSGVGINSYERLVVGGGSKFTDRINVTGGGICISPNPSGIVMDSTSMVIGSGDNDIVNGSDHAMVVGKGNQLLKTASGIGSDHSAAIGQANVLRDAKNSLAIGKSNTIDATGLSGEADGIRSQVLGLNNTLTNTFASFVAGGQNTVGDGNKTGQNTFVLGYSNDVIGSGDNIYALGNQIEIDAEDSESNIYTFGSNLSINTGDFPQPSGNNISDVMIIGIRNEGTQNYTPNGNAGLGEPAVIIGAGSVSNPTDGLIISKNTGSGGSAGVVGSRVIIPDLVNFDFVSDADAAANGIPIGGLYHNSGELRVRLS